MSDTEPADRPPGHLQALLPRLVEVLQEPEGDEFTPLAEAPELEVGPAVPVEGCLPVLQDVVDSRVSTDTPDAPSVAIADEPSQAEQNFAEKEIEALALALEPALVSAVEALAMQWVNERADRLSKALVETWLQELQRQRPRGVGALNGKSPQPAQTLDQASVHTEAVSPPVLAISEADRARWRDALKSCLGHVLALRESGTRPQGQDQGLD